MYVCQKCNSILSVVAAKKLPSDSWSAPRKFSCRMCDQSQVSVKKVLLPYVFRYLTNELAAMNIRSEVLIE